MNKWKNYNFKEYKNQNKYYEMIAREFLECAEKSLEEKDCFITILGGGKTPMYINREIVRLSSFYKIDWGKIYILLSDERYVDEGNNSSNYKMIKETLVDKVNGNQLYPIYKHSQSVEESVSLYCNYIEKLFENLGQDYFDYSLLGVGYDGHTASLFPNRESLDEEDKLVVYGGIGPEGLHRISLSIKSLNKSKLVSFIVNNPMKIKVFKMMNNYWNTKKYPIQNILAPKKLHILSEVKSVGKLL